MKDLEDMVEAKMASKDVQQEPKAWSNTISSLPRPPGLVCLKLVTQDASGLRFRRSTYGWKANLIRKPTQVSHIKISSESMGIVEKSQCPESARVLRHRLFVRWTMYRVWAH